MIGEVYKSGLKKIFVIFTVAIILATISNFMLNKADAIDEEQKNSNSGVKIVDDVNMVI